MFSTVLLSLLRLVHRRGRACVFALDRPAGTTGARLLHQMLDGTADAPVGKKTTVTSQTVSAMGGWLGKMLPSLHNAESQEKLSLAGYSGSDALNTYALVRIFAPLVALVLAASSPAAKPVLFPLSSAACHRGAEHRARAHGKAARQAHPQEPARCDRSACDLRGSRARPWIKL